MRSLARWHFLVGLLSVIATADASAQLSADEQRSKQDTLNDTDVGVGFDLAVARGVSDPLAETAPPENLSFDSDDRVRGFRIRLRAYSHSLGGVVIFHRHDSYDRVGADYNEANSLALLIAGSYHISVLRHRLRMESLLGFAHTRDAAYIRSYDTDESYYTSEFNKIGVGGGLDVVINPMSRVYLHATNLYTTHPIEDVHLGAELLIGVKRWVVNDPGYKSDYTELLLTFGYTTIRKHDKRIDELFYFGIGVGNWMRQ